MTYTINRELTKTKTWNKKSERKAKTQEKLLELTESWKIVFPIFKTVISSEKMEGFQGSSTIVRPTGVKRFENCRKFFAWLSF